MSCGVATACGAHFASGFHIGNKGHKVHKMDAVIVKAKYAYDYKNGQGYPAHMEPGDVFMLIKKSNNDWWYVRKQGDKPVYLPATYLQEQETVPQGGNGERQSQMQGSRHGSHDSMVQEMNKRLNRSTIANVENESSKLKIRPSNLDVIVPAPNDSSQRLHSPYSDKGSPLYPPSRESTVNSGGQAKSSPSITRNDWAVRLQADTSNYPGAYDAPHGGPRAQQKPSRGQGGSTPHSPTTATPSHDDGVPVGWRVEQTVTGQPVFINEATSEKWYKATQNNGEPYFYSEDRSRTCWVLPAVVNSRRRMVSDGDRGGGDERLPIQPTRHGETRPVRPFSFHPHLAPSPDPNLPSDSRFLDRVSMYSQLGNDTGIREKEGALTMILMKDRGRQKRTRPGHGVLAGSQLKYYKDYKHYERDSNNPEHTINLWKADVFWSRGDKSKPTKRTTFEIQTDQGMYMLQGEDEIANISWYEAIKSAVGGQGRSWNTTSSPDEAAESLSSLSVSPASENDVQRKTTIREKLKHFMIRRPEKDDLKRKGILKEENVFGKHIVKLCESNRTNVPNFVVQCIRVIDERGLQCDGIYRVSGNLSLIQKLRFQVDQEKPVDLDASPWKEDIHVITGALKLYFRELPEPLFTFATFDRFIASITQIPGKDKKVMAFGELFRSMPRVNRETIMMLFSHLKRVMDNVQHNRMPAKNLATVFGPTLMWPEKENMHISMATVYQNQVMEFVLMEYDNIFRQN